MTLTTTLSYDSDILRPLTHLEFEELLELYKSKYGESNFHYLGLYNQHKWNKQLLEINATVENDTAQKWLSFRKTFYTHRNGDFREYGTYISLHMDIEQSITFHTWEPSAVELFECLRETSLIDWRAGPLLTNVDLKFSERVQQLAVEKGTTVQRARTCYGFILSLERALNLDLPAIPAGYKLSALKKENAELLHETWVNKKESSLQYIKGTIALCPTLGVYSEIDNELVAWVVENDFAGLGILQVLPKAQRKGLGILLAAHLSKIIANQEQLNVSAWTLTGNFMSRALMEKIGFEKVVVKQWIQLNNVNE